LAALVFLIRRNARAWRNLAVLAIAPLLGACTGFLFQPMGPLIRTPDEVGLAWRDVDFVAADGVRLHGWFLPADRPGDGEDGCTVVFVHGNAENISTHLGSVWWMPARGINVLLVDYRGYGRSEGLPTLDGLHLDVLAGIDAALAAEGVDPDRIAVFGQSLGGSLAISALARSGAHDRVRALVVEGAFTDYREITRQKLADFWLTWPFQWPLSYTVDGDYVPVEDIARLGDLPVLIIHGLADAVIPPEHAEALKAAARGPAELWLVPGAGHIQVLTSVIYQDRLAGWLARAC
jgi:hypothetical protein